MVAISTEQKQVRICLIVFYTPPMSIADREGMPLPHTQHCHNDMLSPSYRWSRQCPVSGSSVPAIPEMYVLEREPSASTKCLVYNAELTQNVISEVRNTSNTDPL